MDLIEYHRIYQKSIEDSVKFWSEIASELHWFKSWDTVLSIDNIKKKILWFLGAKTNITYNALDRNIKAGFGEKVAFYWVGLDGEKKKYTYNDLFSEVNKASRILLNIGVVKGDLVLIILPKIPELISFSLAAARIGAISVILEPTFAITHFKEILSLTNPKVVIASDGIFHRNMIIPIAKRIYEYRKSLKKDFKLIAVSRIKDYSKAPIILDREDCEFHSYEIDKSTFVWPEQLDSNFPLYKILRFDERHKTFKVFTYTHGSHMVGIYATMKLVFDPKEEDIYWCTANIDCIVGQAYGIFGPLLVKLTSLIYEGNGYNVSRKLGRLIQEYNVSILYTKSDDIKELLKSGENIARNFKVSNLRFVALSGKSLSVKEWIKLYDLLGHKPILDTLVSEELGIIVFTPFQHVPLKPTSVFRPIPGVIIDTYHNKQGDEKIVFKKPWPGLPFEYKLRDNEVDIQDVLKTEKTNFKIYRTNDNYFYVKFT